MLDEILQKFKDPYLQQDYVTLGAAKILPQQEGAPALEITLPYPLAAVKQRLEEELREHFAKHKVSDIKLQLKQEIARFNPRPKPAAGPAASPAANLRAAAGGNGAAGPNSAPKPGPAPAASPAPGANPAPAQSQLDGVKNIIAIASGKGGVGKSTMSFHLARALQTIGARVGLMDADIYGPSQPHLLQSKADRQALAGAANTMNPVEVHGIKTMSLRYLLDDNQTPAIWRGAMATNALHQMIFSTRWSELDYLIVDMPPGTGDIQLTLCQRVSLSAAVIITTPHQLAVIGAEKGIEMFRKLYVPVLGIIENMSYYVCPKCGDKHYIFGRDTAARLKHTGAPTLAELPLSPDYNQEQQPTQTEQHWQDLALTIAAALAGLTVHTLPEIEVADD